jgi:hypothetical protein
MSSTGRKIVNRVLTLSHKIAPLSIGIIETPTGFEINAEHSWPERMEQFYRKSFKNYKPKITRIAAWRNDGIHSTNDPDIPSRLANINMCYAGAGSPTYAITHLSHSLLWKSIHEIHSQGCMLIFGSATAIASGRFGLPVYEIFKAGFDPYWVPGLDYFSQYGLPVTIIPHWNNAEGEDFDTTCCYMGKKRFARLKQMLPHQTIFVCIDELTAAIINIHSKTIEIDGLGSVHIIKDRKEYIANSGDIIPFSFF